MFGLGIAHIQENGSCIFSLNKWVDGNTSNFAKNLKHTSIMKYKSSEDKQHSLDNMDVQNKVCESQQPQ